MTDIREEVYGRVTQKVRNSEAAAHILAYAAFPDNVQVMRRVEIQVADQVRFSPKELR